VPKRASNQKNGAAREKWMKEKKSGRTKQIFTLYNDGRTGGYWTKVDVPEEKE
jgi:hypothetical protein